jgi:putative ABC transport system permease protein
MSRLFGVPTGTLAVILAGVLGMALAVIAALAIRNRVFLKMGVRNVARRRGRTALIVVGLMLGTTIISSALSTGDTIATTIRSDVLVAMGEIDEVVQPKGSTDTSGDIGYLDESVFTTVQAALAGSPLVDGVTSAIFEDVAIQDQTSRQTEPRAKLVATDPAHADGFGTIRTLEGETVTLADLTPGTVFIDRDMADELAAEVGHDLTLYADGRPIALEVAAIVDVHGKGGTQPAVLMPLAAAQEILGREGQIRQVLISNEGGETSGATHSTAVHDLLAPTLSPLGLEAVTLKADGLETADQVGTVFMSVFTTFGMFSIAAGVLLIFLIFVMLAAERRSEMGIARAVGTRRGHLVQSFLFEGTLYDVIAAAVGALLGLLVSYGMVAIMARAFALDENGLDIRYTVQPRSVAIAYTIGVLLTLVVVTVSAWRVSRLNIVSAIRNQTEVRSRVRRRFAWLRSTLVLVLGVLLTVSGMSGDQATPTMLGVSISIVGLGGLARALGVPERPAYTAVGLSLVGLWLLPFSVITGVFGDLSMDFSMWVVGGLLVVLGATWTIMYNADVILAGVQAVLGRSRTLAPVLKPSVAYPLRNRFRTGVTLAMFTLVVFNLVVGAVTTAAFTSAFDDTDAFGGGFDVVATVSPLAPVSQIDNALRGSDAVDPSSFDVVARQSAVGLDMRQGDVGDEFDQYVVRGLDDAFLEETTYGMAAMADGYDTADEVWQAMAADPTLAVVDANSAPHRQNFSFGSFSPLRLTGFFVEDGHFSPVPLEVRDPQSGKVQDLTVIGVLKDTAMTMFGVSVSQRALEPYGDRALPTTYLFRTTSGTDAGEFASSLESTFLAAGMQADAVAKIVDDAVGANRTLNNLILGFMGLGLVVGVAALGVISARSVVERRQQIGVLRAIGFRRGMVQASFLIEATFIALTSIVVGSGLGLVLGYNVVADSKATSGWDTLQFSVPWLTLGIVFAVVILAALLATFVPARSGSRVYPSEALRYQ